MTISERVKLACTGLVCLCACFALTGIGFAGFQAREATVAIANDADKITTTVTQQVDALQQPIHESWELVRASRRMVDHVDKAAIDEQFYLEKELPVTVAKLDGVLDAAQASVTSLQPISAAATASLDTLTARMQDLQPVERKAFDVLYDTDVVVNDPAIRQSLTNLSAGTASLASSATHLDSTAADVQSAVHSFVHPSWRVRLVNWLGTAAHAVGGWF